MKLREFLKLLPDNNEIEIYGEKVYIDNQSNEYYQYETIMCDLVENIKKKIDSGYLDDEVTKVDFNTATIYLGEYWKYE